MLDGFYKYAKLQYECGNYQDCLTYLTYYGVLIPNSSQQYLNALWGKLAAEILIFRWEDALADIARINDVIESSVRASRSSSGVRQYGVDVDVLLFDGLLRTL